MPERLCPGHQPRLTAEPCQGRGSVPKGRLYSPVLRRSRRRAHLRGPAHPDPARAPPLPRAGSWLEGRPALGAVVGAGVLGVALPLASAQGLGDTASPRPRDGALSSPPPARGPGGAEGSAGSTRRPPSGKGLCIFFLDSCESSKHLGRPACRPLERAFNRPEHHPPRSRLVYVCTCFV